MKKMQKNASEARLLKKMLLKIKDHYVGEIEKD